MSLGVASLPYFSVQFYRLKIHPSITVQNIEKKNHFYIVSGEFQYFENIYYLSRNLLRSKLLSSFKFEDSLLKTKGKKFKLFLKLKNTRSKNQPLYVSISSPDTFQEFSQAKNISGTCFPNGKRVIVYGGFSDSTICKDGQWKVSLKSSNQEELYLFAQISDSRGGIYFDGRSYVRR